MNLISSLEDRQLAVGLKEAICTLAVKENLDHATKFWIPPKPMVEHHATANQRDLAYHSHDANSQRMF